METRFLESFLVVVECGSVAEAARKLALSPAALGLRLKALESELGYALVTRTGRTMRPTEGGLSLAERCRPLLAALRHATAIEGSDRVAGEVRLGVATSAVAGALARLIVRMIGTYPDVEINVSKGPSSDLYRRLSNGDLDAAIAFRPPFDLPKTLDWKRLRVEPYILVAPASAIGRNAADLLATEPFIRFDRSLWSGQRVDAYLRQMRLVPRERLELDSMEAIAVLVDQGLGVSILPDWEGPWPEGLKLLRLPLPGDPPSRELGLLWPRNSPRARLVEAIRQQAS